MSSKPNNQQNLSQLKGHRRLCAIQMSCFDLTEASKAYNCINKIKESALFDHIAIVAPEIPENTILESLARQHGIDILLGPVMNVAERILQASKIYNCDIILRVLYNWFFIDIKLVADMLSLLEREEKDLLRLPLSFDIRFGGDVFTQGFLEKVIKDLDLKNETRNEFLFNPWGYAECCPGRFNAATFENVPVYDGEYFAKLGKLMRKVWPERWDGASCPAKAYGLPKRFLSNKMKIMDLACGTGAGSACLANEFSQVTGVDISKEAVDAANSSYRNRYDNLEFLQTSYSDLDLKNEFDAVVSIHTMEHMPDDNDFLEKCSELLRLGGWIFLEVPLLMRLPFAGISEPLAPHHTREYDIPALRSLVSDHFEIANIYGVNRGCYLETDKARNAVFVVARKSSDKKYNNSVTGEQY